MQSPIVQTNTTVIDGSYRRLILSNTLYRIGRACLPLVSMVPITRNLIAIGLGCVILVLMQNPWLLPTLAIGKYHPYAVKLIYLLMGWQCVKSARRSLLLPLIAMLLAGVGFLFVQYAPQYHLIELATAQGLLLAGVLGAGLAIFTIR